MKLAAWAVVVCVLEDPHEERYEAASKTAPTARDGHTWNDLLTFLSAGYICAFSLPYSVCLFTASIHFFPKSLNV